MFREWKQTSTAGDGGQVSVVVPELKPGDVVEVCVRFDQKGETNEAERPVGLLKDQIKMMADFDAPLDACATRSKPAAGRSAPSAHTTRR